MTDEFLIKMAVIAGASKALKLKEENPRWSDEKVLQKINISTKEIVGKLDRE